MRQTRRTSTWKAAETGNGRPQQHTARRTGVQPEATRANGVLRALVMKRSFRPLMTDERSGRVGQRRNTRDQRSWRRDDGRAPEQRDHEQSNKRDGAAHTPPLLQVLPCIHRIADGEMPGARSTSDGRETRPAARFAGSHLSGDAMIHRRSDTGAPAPWRCPGKRRKVGRANVDGRARAPIRLGQTTPLEAPLRIIALNPRDQGTDQLSLMRSAGLQGREDRTDRLNASNFPVSVNRPHCFGRQLKLASGLRRLTPLVD